MAAEYRELIGSPQEEVGSKGFTATRQIIAAWSDRWQVVQDVLGDSDYFGATGLAQYPGQDNVLTVNVSMRPFHEDLIRDVPADIELDLASYSNYVFIQLKYEMVEPSVWPLGTMPNHQPNTQLTYSSDFGVKAKIVQARGLKWIDSPGGAAGDPVTEHDAVNVARIPTGHHRLSWHRVLLPNLTVIRAKIGKTNAGAFLGAVAPETIMFTGYTINREFVVPFPLITSSFFQGWRVDYNFEEQRIDEVGLGGVGGWNHAYRSTPPEKAGWYQLIDADGNKLHPTTDFADLFYYPEE